jgi:hypothetical protein
MFVATIVINVKHAGIILNLEIIVANKSISQSIRHADEKQVGMIVRL